MRIPVSEARWERGSAGHPAGYDRGVRSFRRFSAAVLAYNLAVILWGAVVRATGSGAGCGNHWPSCNGAVVPRSASTATLVEYSHRLSSGLVLVLVLVLAVWAFRVSSPGHPVRRGAVLAVAFTLSEAAVGAGLVLFRLVARDESLGRALGIGTHLLNTFLLLAALALTWHHARARAQADTNARGRVHPDTIARGRAFPDEIPAPGDPLRAEGGTAPRRPLAWLCWTAAAAVMAVGATGAVSALGDTLFPAATLAQGLAQELAPAAHVLLRLRVVHPFLALAAGFFLLYLCQRAAADSPGARTWANRLRLLVLAQWAAGVLDVGLLAPVWLQLVHLLLADLVWLALVLLAAAVLDVPASLSQPELGVPAQASLPGRDLSAAASLPGFDLGAPASLSRHDLAAAGLPAAVRSAVPATVPAASVPAVPSAAPLLGPPAPDGGRSL
jgi:cytochrome c oxidase assembly protein subunit 15